jgi:hypothetical protein
MNFHIGDYYIYTHEQKICVTLIGAEHLDTSELIAGPIFRSVSIEDVLQPVTGVRAQGAFAGAKSQARAP